MSAPLNGIRVVEFGGIGPAPFAGMLLADLGAAVTRIDKRSAPGTEAAIPGLDARLDPTARAKKVLALDLKAEADREAAWVVIGRSDVLIEGFRPGVMERLDFAPGDCAAINPRLIYARMTGWGQEGPLAARAGHDINYLALSGVLHALGGLSGKPHAPLNLLGDYAGGSLFLVIGILAALLERGASGEGKVVDAAIVDGVSSLATVLHGLRAQGLECASTGHNVLDGGHPFYSTYVCADGGYVALGALEERFFEIFAAGTTLDPADFRARHDPSNWPSHRARLEALFLTRARDEWARLFEGQDACLTPVLTLDEAPNHPHAIARGAFHRRGNEVQPRSAPRFRAIGEMERNDA
jgi:alpha-methylacyl-CoA racemase